MNAVPLALSLFSSAQAADPDPITVGETHHLVCEACTEAGPREVNVFLPAGYEGGEARYPVLYLIDGGLEQDFLHVAGATALNATLERSLPVLVVGVQTIDRRAELIGTKGNAEEHPLFPTAGDAAAFRSWIRDEVVPLVESRYRADGRSAVMGESLAGLFVAETWLVEPELFDGYAAIGPSLWWNEGALAASADERVSDGRDRGPIYLSYANEGPVTERGTTLVAAAAKKQGCLVPRPDLTHATAYHVLVPQALQYLFPTDQRFDKKLGFDVPCTKAKVRGQ